MKLSSISVEDIRNLVNRKLTIEMPDYKATCSARQMVTYTKKAYPLPDGMDLETTTDTEKNIITISVVEK